MTARFVREGVVHLGHRVDTEDGWQVYFLCEKRRLMSALYGWPGFDNPPVYEPGIEVFHVFDDVDCMTCLVLEAHRV